MVTSFETIASIRARARGALGGTKLVALFFNFKIYDFRKDYNKTANASSFMATPTLNIYIHSIAREFKKT